MMRSASQHLAVMAEAARRAARVQMKHFGKISASKIQDKSTNDLVTFVDRRSQDLILQTLKKRFPAYGVVAEESDRPTRRERTWVIDPLDGTVNFIHHFPLFAVSIALTVREKPVLGLVYDPVHEEWFTAVRGEGAHLNRRRIRVSSTRRLNKAFVVTGFPFRSKQYFEPYHESFRRVFYASSGIRRGGSAAIDLCYTACGRADGFWEWGLKEWDMAAGTLLVREAGGSVSDFQGTSHYIQRGDIVAGNPSIQRQLLKIVKKVPGFFREPYVSFDIRRNEPRQWSA